MSSLIIYIVILFVLTCTTFLVKTTIETVYLILRIYGHSFTWDDPNYNKIKEEKK